jgi:ribosomal protein L16 Arg81 hydroxylase
VLGLAELVAPLSPDEFLDRHWPQQAWCDGESPERAERLTAAVPELGSAQAVLEGARPVSVFKPDGTVAAVPDGKAAWPLYMLGLTCYVSARHVAGVQPILTQLTADLGLPAGSMESEVFCSDGRSGARMHSDFDLNFAVLLRGSKRWRVAPNRHVRNQTGVCVPSTREQPSPFQLEIADETPFPAEMPADATTFEVGPGGVVFLPRGWWHETEAEGECLQVNFVVKRPLWLRIMTAAIGEQLMRDPGWRGFALDLFGPEERRERAVAELASLLPSFRSLLDELLDGDPEAVARRIIEHSGVRPS